MRLAALALTFGLVALTGCRSSALSDAERSEIPQDAAAAVITSDLSAGELYAATRKHLHEMGFVLRETEGDGLVIVTEKLGVGRTMTELRLVGVVEKRMMRKPRLVLSGEYSFPPYGYQRARNKKSARNRDAMAFEEILLIARQLPHTNISFWTTEQLDETGFGKRNLYL